MKLSGVLAIGGAVLVLAQHFWAPGDEVPMPWHLAPLIVGLLALLVAAGLGVARGTGTYRLAVVIGLGSVVLIGVAIMVPLGPFVPTATPPSPRPGEVVLDVGLALGALSALTGAVAVVRDRRPRPRDIR